MQHTLPAWQAVFVAVLGVFFLAAGYRSMRVTARIFSAVIFASIGLGFAQHHQAPAWAAVGSAVGGGILGYLLGNLYYYLNMAVTGAAAGFVLTAIGSIVAAGQVNLGLALVAAVVGAFAAIVFERGIGIFATSILGGACLMSAARSMTGHAPHQHVGLYAGLFVGLTVVGCVIQNKTAKNLPGKAGPPAKK